MMLFLRFILQIVLLTVIALWLADRPGSAHIIWHDTVIDTSAAFLALCILVLAYVFYLFFRLWHFLRHGPAHWRLRGKLKKIQKGQDQLTEGLIAIASGNAIEAGRLAVSARKNIGNTTATYWLQAQAAQLAGDHRAAQEIFRTLAADENAAVLGYRGLITEARRLGKWDDVDRLLNELYRLKPMTPWLSLMRMENAARKRLWGEAEAALSHAVSAHLLDSKAGRRTRAALKVAASRSAAADHDNETALQAAEQAVRQAPDWLPAILNLTGLLAMLGHQRAATRAIERAWKTQAHPELAATLRRMATSPLEAFKKTEHMCRGLETETESRMALAEAALAANIWGEARRYLTFCVNDGKATQGVYKMLARLERQERTDEHSAATWLAKASEAAPDPLWLCKVCGGSHQAWQPICTYCGSFDTLEWQSAGKSRDILLS